MTARTGSDHLRPTLGPWSAGLYLIDVVGTRWTTLASHPEPFMAGDWFGTPVWPMSSFHSGIGLLPQRELWVLGPSSSPRPTADGGGSFSPRIAALTGLGPIHGTPCGARAAGPHRSVRALGPLLSATLPEGAQPFTREGCLGRKTRIQFRMRRRIPVEEADGCSPWIDAASVPQPTAGLVRARTPILRAAQRGSFCRESCDLPPLAAADDPRVTTPPCSPMGKTLEPNADPLGLCMY